MDFHHFRSPINAKWINLTHLSYIDNIAVILRHTKQSLINEIFISQSFLSMDFMRIFNCSQSPVIRWESPNSVDLFGPLGRIKVDRKALGGTDSLCHLLFHSSILI